MAGTGEDMVFDDTATDQVLLNDALEDFGRGGVVPDSIRVNDGDGSLFADTEAVGLGAEDAVEDAEFGETALEIVPGLDSSFKRAALGFGLLGA